MTDTTTAKRGRKAITEPNEIDKAWAEYMHTVHGETLTPRAIRLMQNKAVRETFFDSDLYKDAVAERNARIDAVKAISTAKSMDALLSKLSPEMKAALAAALAG